MKSIQFVMLAIASLAITFETNAAFASPDCVPELQFVGKVHNVRAVRAPVDVAYCTYQVEIVPSWDNKTDPNCPLEEITANQLVFVDASCLLTEGLPISGYMTYQNGKASIR